jgi:hypothetical protein
MIIQEMKKIFNLSACICLLALAGCSNSYESVFEESADERVKKALAEYRSALVGSTDGWVATLYPGAGGGYTFYFDFNEDGTVTMISDFNTTTAGTSMEGTFVMKGLQRPTLSFDTYSYIHLLADPESTINGGENGVGLISDFEFAFTKQSNDTLKLKGIQRNSDIILIKATAQQRATYLSGALEQSIIDATDYFTATPYSYVELNGTTFFFYPNRNTRVFSTFFIDQNEAVVQSSETFSFTPTGFSLTAVARKPFSAWRLCLQVSQRPRAWPRRRSRAMTRQHSRSLPVPAHSAPARNVPNTNWPSATGRSRAWKTNCVNSTFSSAAPAPSGTG